LRQFIFLAVVLTILGAVNFYLYSRLVGATAVPGVWRWSARTFFLLATLATPLPFVLSHYSSPGVARAAAWPVFLWVGLMFILFSLCLSVDVVRVLLWFGRMVSGAEPPDPERALAIRRWLAVAITGVGLLASIFGAWNAFRAPMVRGVTVEIEGLPAGLEGFTIAQITDLHIGLMRDGAWLAEIVDRTNRLSPDLVAVTGDLVDVPFPTEHFAKQLEPIRDLKATHGSYFITGNHEYYGDTVAWMNHLQTLGLTWLRNQRLTIRHGGDSFELAGVVDPTDPHSEGAVSRALSGRPPGRPVVLLAHQPKVIQEAADHGVALMLSGHTHGGQIWPFRYFVMLQTPYISGLYDHEGTKLYVSEGTGFWGPPMRLFTRSEITLLTLRAPK
jgi:predicted MPP superfamily phosphohydrolase